MKATISKSKKKSPIIKSKVYITISIHNQTVVLKPVTRRQSNPSSKKVHPKQESIGANAIRGTKIVRNYAKALCSFAYSDMALTYLKDIISKKYNDSLEVESFRKYIREKKGKTASILSLRSLLMEDDDDTEKERIYKQIFTEISVVFIKFFAVNWIFSGKVKYRLEHLKYRHKMLRRIRNPEHFTYLKSSSG